MAKLAICSVYDSAIQGFARPMFVVHVGAALRGFADEINRIAEDNPLSKHPDDYSLFYLGDFNEETGEFLVGDDEPRVLMRGKDAVRS